MSLLSKYAKPAEIQRGCVFAENFESSANVVLNEGTITSTPTINNSLLGNGVARITYPVPTNYSTALSISVWIRFTGTLSAYKGLVAAYGAGGSSGFDLGMDDTKIYATTRGAGGGGGEYNYSGLVLNDGSWHHICYTVSSTNHIVYVDGVSRYSTGSGGIGLVASVPLTVGSRGTSSMIPSGFEIKNTKLFNVTLTSQEVLDYASNSTFNYDSKCVLNLPMTAECHDATNLKTLDKSGKGYNATFGNGSTSATFPTKLQGRGYSFDGGDYLNLGDVSALNLQDFSFAVLYKRGSTISTGQTILGCQLNVAAGYYTGWDCRMQIANTISFLKATDVNTRPASLTTATFTGQEYLVIIGVKSGTSFKLYVNNQLVTDATFTSATMNYTNSTTKSTLIGAEYSDSGSVTYANQLVGSEHQTMITPTILTPIQVYDLTLKMMKKINWV